MMMMMMVEPCIRIYSLVFVCCVGPRRPVCPETSLFRAGYVLCMQVLNLALFGIQGGVRLV